VSASSVEIADHGELFSRMADHESA